MRRRANGLDHRNAPRQAVALQCHGSRHRADRIIRTLREKARHSHHSSQMLRVRKELPAHPNPLARIPMHCPSDRDALDFALGYLGSPPPEQQRIVWIRNTVQLGRIGCSQALASEASKLSGWQLEPEPLMPQFDEEGNMCSPFEDVDRLEVRSSIPQVQTP